MRDKGHSFLRAFSILDAVVDSPVPMSHAELSEKVGLTKPTARRLCELLESQLLLERNVDGKRYVPGPKLRSLSMGVLGSSALLLDRQTVMQSTSTEIGETCNFAVPNGTQMLYVDRVETDWPLRIALPIGTRVPLHCTASGKLYLSQLASRERKQLIGTLSLERFTPNTITDPNDLLVELKKIRAQGFGVDNEEFYEGMVAVSAPINDSNGRICAALAVHGPVLRFPMSNAIANVPTLKQAAKRLERSLLAE